MRLAALLFSSSSRDSHCSSFRTDSEIAFDDGGAVDSLAASASSPVASSSALTFCKYAENANSGLRDEDGADAVDVDTEYDGSVHDIASSVNCNGSWHIATYECAWIYLDTQQTLLLCLSEAYSFR